MSISDDVECCTVCGAFQTHHVCRACFDALPAEAGRVLSRDEVLREVATELERMAVMSSSVQRRQGWLDAARLVEGMVSDA